MIEVFTDHFDQIVNAWLITLRMVVIAGIGSLVIGSILASMRVSPVKAARAVGTFYVYVVRNTPLLVIMMLFAFGFPQLGIVPRFNFGEARILQFNNFFIFCTAALTFYTAAFVCEALRSGINTIDMGQAEASRSIGMTFGQTLRHIVLPQAFRAVIQPIANALIAMVKNSTLAAGVGVAEAAFLMQKLINDNATQLWPLFFGFAAGYVVLVAVISVTANFFERKVRVS